MPRTNSASEKIELQSFSSVCLHRSLVAAGRKEMKHWKSYSTAVATALLVSGCGENDQITGKWAGGEGAQIGQVEFLSNGSCLMPSKGVAPSCTWQVLDDSRIVMRQSIYGSTFTFMGHKDGENLIFHAPDGTTMAPLHRG
jgi:hypothetical protein